jgi:biotin carboxyl carrier protein
MAKRHRLLVGETERTVTIEGAAGESGTSVVIDDGEAIAVEVVAAALPGLVTFFVAGTPQRAYVVRRGGAFEVTVGERRFVVEPAVAARRGRRVVGGAEDLPGTITSPLAGVVVAVQVEVGNVLQAGATVLVLEAMKMQNEVQIPRDGTISAVHVAAGDNVEKAVLLVEYELAEDGGE